MVSASLRSVCFVSASALFAGCQSAPPAVPAELHGEGLIGVDRAPPDGVQAYGQPQWMVGDRFVYRRGEAVRLPFRVVQADDERWILQDEETGRQAVLTPELAVLGECGPDGTWGRQEDPMDVQLAWPLWVGKRWRCHVVRKAPDGSALPLLLSYRCDAKENVDTPAGTFECLRIWRTSSVAAEGDYLQRTVLLWYAPKAGWFVRRLENGVLVELEQLFRQTEPIEASHDEAVNGAASSDGRR